MSQGKWRTRAVVAATVVVMVLAVLSGCAKSEDGDSDSAAPAQTVVFHLNHFLPATHPVNVNMLEPFAEQVYEETEGRVEVIVHPGNELAAPTDTYDAVVSGVCGMGFVLPAYTPGRFPMTQILEYPFMFTSALQANLTARDMAPMLRENEYTDTQLLWVGGTDLGHILLKAPIQHLSDLRGRKLRSPGPIYNEVIEALGGVEVSLPVSDLYDAMDRGVVEGTVMAPSALLSFRLMDVTEQIVVMNMYTTPLIFFANLDLWNQVSAEDQQIIMAIADTFPQRIGEQYDFEVEHAMAAAEEAGKDIVTLPASDMAQLHALVEPLIAGWVAELDDMGKPGTELYNLARTAAASYAQ